ncbi:MAG: cytochrome P450 [Methylococcaceae bacterium]|nr:cytochrome P450 [Methylococcaceae bacterium]
MITEKRLNSLAQLSGPKGVPILGNLLQVDVQKLHTIMEEWSAIYGSIYKFKLANRTVVAISDPVLIQNILRDRPKTYRRFSSIERVGAELGSNGLVAAEGKQWQHQRQITMQAFKTKQLQSFFPVMRNITERLKNCWDKIADTEQAIDIKEDWVKYTVDLTTNFAFGYDINLLEQEGDGFQIHLQRFLPVYNRRANAPFPYWHFIKLPDERRMEKSLDIIKEKINLFVQQTRKKLEQQSDNTIEAANFLEALLLTKGENGQYLTDAEIQGNIITILLAGEDTTAYTLAWLVHLMAEHPEIQHKMQVEVDTVLGADSIPQDLSAIEKLNYIEAVAHETLRLKSVAPLFFMEPNEDVELAGTNIPKGTFLMLVTRYAALQKENFSDPLEFKPERWLESAATGCVHNRNANIPFGAGPRFCPGRNLALLEIKIAMAMLCKNFSITRAETEQPVQEVFSFTMMPDKVMVKFETR